MSITKQMEGNGPTGAMLIPHYIELQAKLKVWEQNSSDALYPMIAAMITKAQGYLDEALACETLVMATLLHPDFRINFFEKISSTYINADSTFNRLFKEYQVQSTQKKGPTLQSEDQGSVSRPSISAMFDVYSDNEANDEDLGNDSQVKDYLRGTL